MSPLVWVTGAGGLIGSNVVNFARKNRPHWDVLGLTRQQLDLCNSDAVREAFSRQQPAVIVHCAALSQSPLCQADPLRARLINVTVTKHLADLAQNARLIFLSSDLVFDGHRGGYREADAVHPLSVYAETKVEAEQFVLAHPNHCVIRTSLNGGTSPTHDRGFNEQLRLAWQRGETTRLFIDEYRSPVCAQVTARALWDLIEKNVSGIFHLAGAGRISRWEIGNLVAARCPELQPRIEAGSLKTYSGAPRAPDTSLNCDKVQPFLSFQLPSLADWLSSHPEEPF